MANKNETSHEMEDQAFSQQLEQTSTWFLSLKNSHRNEALDHLIEICEPQQLYMLAAKLNILLKRDFIKRLPPELSSDILKYISPEELCKSCVISKSWNEIINGNVPLWRHICVNAGIQIRSEFMHMDAAFYKQLYIHAKRRIKSIDRHLECMSLSGHSERITALAYYEGKIASGSDDRTVRIWDGANGECLKVIETHSVAALKFDNDRLLTASYDTTAACWSLADGSKSRLFEGHVAAVFCLDYNVEHDRLVTGSADKKVKLWSLSEGRILKTFKVDASNGFWIRQVNLCYKLEYSNQDSAIKDTYMIACRNKYSFAVYKMSRADDSVIDSEKKILSPGPETHDTFGIQQMRSTVKMLYRGSENNGYDWNVYVGHRPLNFFSQPTWSRDLGGSYRLQCKEFPFLSWNEERTRATYLGAGTQYDAVLKDYDGGLHFLDVHFVGKRGCRGTLRGTVELDEFANVCVSTIGESSWLDGLDGTNDSGVVFATTAHSTNIHVYKWKESKFDVNSFRKQQDDYVV